MGQEKTTSKGSTRWGFQTVHETEREIRERNARTFIRRNLTWGEKEAHERAYEEAAGGIRNSDLTSMEKGKNDKARGRRSRPLHWEKRN